MIIKQKISAISGLETKLTQIKVLIQDVSNDIKEINNEINTNIFVEDSIDLNNGFKFEITDSCDFASEEGSMDFNK